MKSSVRAALLAAALGIAAQAIAQDTPSTSMSEGKTRVIIGGGLGGGFGAKYKVNGGNYVTFTDRFKGSPDDTPTVAVKVATFGIALAPGLYAGLDLSGVAKAGNVPAAGAPTTLQKTSVSITDYFAAVTYFPWESGLFLKGGAGISSFARVAESLDTIRGTGFGFFVGAGFALRLSGAHHLTLTVEQAWQSYGGSGTNKPDNSQFGAAYLGYLYKN